MVKRMGKGGHEAGYRNSIEPTNGSGSKGDGFFAIAEGTGSIIDRVKASMYILAGKFQIYRWRYLRRTSAEILATVLQQSSREL